MILAIEIRASNPQPARPNGPVNTLQDFMAALGGLLEPSAGRPQPPAG